MTDQHLGRPRFDADELGDGDGSELRAALESGRLLERSIDDVQVRVHDEFTAGVMAAIAGEPAPGAVGFMTPLRRRGLIGGFASSLRQAWFAVTAPSLPSFARATALAYVLVVAVAGVALAGAATISVGSALGMFGPAPSTSPTPTSTQAPPPATLAPPTVPVVTEEPESDEPGESPDASDDHGGASATGEPGDDGDHSGPGSSGSGSGGDGGDDGGGSNSGPGSSGSGSDDGSGSGSGPDATNTPRPSDTPRPTGTPKPSETAH